MTAAIQPRTPGPAYHSGSRFASPSRAPHRRNVRPANRRASRKLASGFFRSNPAPHARRVAAQAADERPACTIFSYQTASGYTVAPNSGDRAEFTITIGGSGAYVDSFPYANKTNADCGIAMIRNAETVLTNTAARPWDAIVGLLGEPQGTFDEGGAGMTRPRANLNSALNPIGFQAATVNVTSQNQFVSLVSQGNLMAIPTKYLLEDHIVLVVPIGPAYTSVTVYNNGPRTSSGNADVRVMPATDAANLLRPQPQQYVPAPVKIITPMPHP